MRARVLLIGLLFSVTPLQAATEYLRFEGVIPDSFGPQYTNDGYLYYNWGDSPVEPLGLAVGTFVYFDFAVDTGLDTPFRSDDCRDLPAYCLQDYFQAAYLGGTLRGDFEAYGVTHKTLEVDLSELGLLGAEVVLGTGWGNFGPLGEIGPDRRISNWQVGYAVSWFVGSAGGNVGHDYDSRFPRVQLQVTYRDTIVPPVITPAPAGGWLLLTSIAAVLGRGAVVRNRGS